MTPPTETTATGLKEAIARLVDHSAWRWHDKWLDEAETETMRGRAASLRKDAKGHVARSLATADAILALLPSASVGGEREALRMARDLIATIEQTSGNVWWVNADDPETAVFDTSTAIDLALAAPETPPAKGEPA